MSDTITITGNIAAEPRLVHTATGVPITTFRVASGQRRLDRSTQQWIDSEPNWYQVSAFRRLAVNAYASLRKGQRVVVTGRLRLRDWSNGDKHGTTAEIDADALGHDLRFGTSSFHGSPKRADGESAEDASSLESLTAEARGDDGSADSDPLDRTDASRDEWALADAPF